MRPGFDSWQDLMRGIKAGPADARQVARGGDHRGDHDAAEARDAAGRHVLPPGFLDRLADAIVSLEYYMETLQAGRSDPWYMLDNAQTCVQALEAAADTRRADRAAARAGRYAKTVQISRAPPTAGRQRRWPASMPQPRRLPASPARAERPALAEHADPELMKLFIEEAHEELAKIQRGFPVWDQNPLERDALLTVRRSFHTLKGSGRMVGARDLGEFAWSIENLLNRVLDNTLHPLAGDPRDLRSAVAALPELIRQLESGARRAYRSRGDRLARPRARGRPPEPRARHGG